MKDNKPDLLICDNNNKYSIELFLLYYIILCEL